MIISRCTNSSGTPNTHRRVNMKKSKIVLAAGAFVALTLFLGFKQEDTKMYEKQRNFSSSSEILEVLNSKPLRTYDDKGSKEQMNEALECFSQRKRIADTDLHYDKIEIKEVIKLTDEQQKAIINDYTKLREKFSKRKPISKTEAVRIKIKPYYMEYADDGEEKYTQMEGLVYMNLVLVDEGEGMVIDYISESREQDVIEG